MNKGSSEGTIQMLQESFFLINTKILKRTYIYTLKNVLKNEILLSISKGNDNENL